MGHLSSHLPPNTIFAITALIRRPRHSRVPGLIS
jgi:hypothetical protein